MVALCDLPGKKEDDVRVLSSNVHRAMSGAAHGGPGAHFGSNHHHDAHRFGSSASTQTQELPASTIRGLQHEQLVVNPLYLNLLQEQASLNVRARPFDSLTPGAIS